VRDYEPATAHILRLPKIVLMDKLDDLYNPLVGEAFSGRSHLWSWWILSLTLSKRSDLLRTAPIFFGLTLKAHATEAILTLGRQLGRGRDRAGLRRLLDCAHQNRGRFKAATPEEARKLLKQLEGRLNDIEDKFKQEKGAREKIFAHSSLKALPGDSGFSSRLRKVLNGVFQAQASLQQVDRLYRDIEEVLNEFAKRVRVFLTSRTLTSPAPTRMPKSADCSTMQRAE
jgi:AbiU2